MFPTTVEDLGSLLDVLREHGVTEYVFHGAAGMRLEMKLAPPMKALSIPSGSKVGPVTSNSDGSTEIAITPPNDKRICACGHDLDDHTDFGCHEGCLLEKCVPEPDPKVMAEL